MAITLGELLIKLTAKTDAFQKGMSDAKKLAFDSSGDIVASLGRIGESLTKLKFENLNQAAASLSRIGGIVSGVAVGIATASLAAAEHVAQQAKEIDKLSQSYGLSVQQISAFRVAASITGVSLDTITSGMSRLAKNAATVAESVGGSSSKGAGAAFKALNISVTDSKGRLLPLNDLLGTVADKFSRMENSTTKTALAIQIFGKGGAAMIPFLNQGKEGLERLRQISDELGLTWQQKDITAAKEFAESVELLKLKSEALEEQFVKGLLPALNNIVTAFTKVDSSGNSVAHTFGESVGEAFKGVAEIAATLGHDLGVIYLTLRELADIDADPTKAFNKDFLADYENQLKSLDQQLKATYATLEKTNQDILSTFPTQGGDVAGRVSALNKLFGDSKQSAPALGGATKEKVSNWAQIAEWIKQSNADFAALLISDHESWELEKNITKELREQQGLRATAFPIDLSKGLAPAPTPGFKPDAYSNASKYAKQIADQLNSLDYTEGLKRSFDELEIRMGGALGGARAFFRQYSEYAKQTGQQVYDALANAFNQLEDTLADFFTTFKANWAALAQSIEKEIVKIAIRGLITGPLSGALGKLFGAKRDGNSKENALWVELANGGIPGVPGGSADGDPGGSAKTSISGVFSKLWASISGIFKNLGSILSKVFSSIGSFFGGIFGGGRAAGGPVSAGTLYEVNEGRQREFFKPNVGGHIIPLGQMAAAGGGFTFAPTYYITTPNADTFRKSQHQLVTEGLDSANRAQRRR